MKLKTSYTFLPKKAYFLLLTLLVAVATACGGSEDEPDIPGVVITPDGDSEDEPNPPSDVIPNAPALTVADVAGDWTLESVVTENGKIDVNLSFTVLPLDLTGPTEYAIEQDGKIIWAENFYPFVMDDAREDDESINSMNYASLSFMGFKNAPLSSAMVRIWHSYMPNRNYQLGWYILQLYDAVYENQVLYAPNSIYTEVYYDDPDNSLSVHSKVYEGTVVMRKVK